MVSLQDPRSKRFASDPLHDSSMYVRVAAEVDIPLPFPDRDSHCRDCYYLVPLSHWGKLFHLQKEAGCVDMEGSRLVWERRNFDAFTGMN